MDYINVSNVVADPLTVFSNYTQILIIFSAIVIAGFSLYYLFAQKEVEK